MIDKNKIKEDMIIILLAFILLSSGFFLINSPISITGLVVYDESTAFEAEDMELSGTYESSSNCVCSNPSGSLCAENTGNSSDVGYIIYGFDLNDGLYDIALNHCPEDDGDRKSTRLNSSHIPLSRMPSSA